VIHQIIDGEAVIINLARGFYYSLDKVGADVWSGIEAGLSRADLVRAVERAYHGDDIDSGVGAWLDQMVSEELIVEELHDGGPASAHVTDGLDGARAAFEPPVLHKYTDLEDLLLLDPIHQVDETGWPDARGAASQSNAAGSR
jgi:hypothetical protein